MTQNDAFTEIPERDIAFLLNDLEKDIPNSIHALTFLKVIQRWKSVDSSLEAKILALNGDFRTRILLFYTLSSDKQHLRGSIHKWSHREDDIDTMTKALKQTKEIVPWHVKRVDWSDLTAETVTAVKPAIAEIWGTTEWEMSSDDVLYWVPKEEAVTWEIKIPDGTQLSFLDGTHLKEILELWRWNNEGSEELFIALLQVNFGMGLFDSATGELMSWAFHTYYGALGVLHTKERHRRKGYGLTVLKATGKEMALRGFDVHLIVTTDNIASRSLYEKCNFRLAYTLNWIEKIVS